MHACDCFRLLELLDCYAFAYFFMRDLSPLSLADPQQLSQCERARPQVCRHGHGGKRIGKCQIRQQWKSPGNCCLHMHALMCLSEILYFLEVCLSRATRMDECFPLRSLWARCLFLQFVLTLYMPLYMLLSVHATLYASIHARTCAPILHVRSRKCMG